MVLKIFNISFNLLKQHHLCPADNIMVCYIFKSLYCLLASNLIKIVIHLCWLWNWAYKLRILGIYTQIYIHAL